MKLKNLFSNIGNYYGKIRKEHDKLNDELAELRKKLVSATATFADEQLAYKKVCELKGKSDNVTPAENRQHVILSKAENRVSAIKDLISDVERSISPLRRICGAPGEYALSKQTIEDNLLRQTSLNRDLEKMDATIAKVGSLIADLEEKIVIETKAVTQELLTKEGPFEMPEFLTKLKMELEIRKASQAELQSKRQSLVTELSALLDELKEAEHQLIYSSSVICEIELQEALLPIMRLFARAAVARYRYSAAGLDVQRYEVVIPDELIKQAENELDEDFPKMDGA